MAITAQSVRYWQNFLQDFTSTSRVWLDGFDIPVHVNEEKESKFSSEKITLSPQLTNSLKALSKKTKITYEEIFQAAWGILLNRYTSSDDVLFGLGMLDKKTNQKISILNPLLPVRSSVHENESILNHLKKFQKQIKQSQKHYSGIKDDSIPKDELNYLFLLPSKKTKKEKLTVNPQRYPLVLMMPTTKQPKIEMLYSSTKFTKGSIANILRHFIVILEKISQDHEQSVTHFSILTSTEKQKILNEWSKPYYDCDMNLNECIQDLFYLNVKKNPEKLAVFHANYSLTYQELDDLSNQLGRILLEKGITSGDSVVVLMERTPAIFVAMFAIFKIGAIYIPINPKYPDERIQFIITDCDANIILVNNTDRIIKEFLPKTLAVDDHYALLQNIDKKKLSTIVLPEQIAYAIYTSGTTGQPKGVLIKHSSLVNLAQWYKDYFFVNEEDRASQFASQGFDAFFCETIPFFAWGASVHIIDDNSKLTPNLLLPWLAEQKITVADIPAAYAQILFTMQWPDNLSLRTVKIGGESVSHYPAQVFPFDIWNGYGPTESTVEVVFCKFFEGNTSLDKQSCKHLPPPIGKPIINSEVYVVDEYEQPVPVGVVGEMLIGGMGLSVGYINRPQLTREKFIRNPFSEDQDSKLYKSGDLARWLNDGNLEFVGRVDHQIKIRGYRIELSEIETTIGQFPDVQEVVVLAKENVNQQKALMAYLVPNLDKLRIPYQERCLITTDDMKFYDVITEDISKEGLAITGINETFPNNQSIKINLKLPGMNESQWLTGKIIWQQDHRVGIHIQSDNQQKKALQKSVEYYLSTHNLIHTLESAAAKRSLRKALKKKLPDYMIPSAFTLLTEFPLTFNGKIDLKALPPPKDFERLLERKFVAPRTKTEKSLAEIWANLLNQKNISITDNFFDLGGNSLLVSQLSVAITQKFKISVPAKIFFDLPFIPILAEYIDSKGKKYTTKSSIQEEIFQDAALHENILPVKNHNEFIKNPRGVLLTGAGGFLGIYLLRELIAATNAKIYCLIRKGGFDSVAKRLMENINHYQLSDDISLANRRIVLIPSDIGLDKFGIPSDLYDNLTQNVDVIFHCGAQVNTMASYTSLRTSNVQGTIEILKFATQKVNKSIHYISTLSAAYKLDSKGRFAEEFPNANPDDLIGGYAISKWVSERLLTQIKNRGLPIFIYRSGYILGQSDTGIMNLNDALLLFIKGCIQLGIAPNWKEKITILPVDFVSKAIVNIALAEPEESSVYHLDHPYGMMWTDLVSWLNNFGYKIKLCSHKEWLERLTKISQENAIFPFLPQYLAQEKEPNTPETGMDNAMRILNNLHIPYPEIDDALLHRYMNYLCKVGFLPTPFDNKQFISG